jgi:hypothetical protein
MAITNAPLELGVWASEADTYKPVNNYRDGNYTKFLSYDWQI